MHLTFWNSLTLIDHNFETKSPIELKQKKKPNKQSKKKNKQTNKQTKTTKQNKTKNNKKKHSKANFAVFNNDSMSFSIADQNFGI